MVTLLENGRSIIVFDPHFQSCHRGAQGDQEKENHSHFHFQLNQISSATHIWFESVDQSRWSRNWSWGYILKTGDKLSGEGLWLSHFGARGDLVGGRRGGHCRYLGLFSAEPDPVVLVLTLVLVLLSGAVRRNMPVVEVGEESSSTANNLIFLPPFLCGYYVQSCDTALCVLYSVHCTMCSVGTY